MSSGLRKIIFFILLVGVTYCGYQYVIKPANRNLAEKKTKVEKSLAKLTEFEKATVAAKNLNEQVEQLEQAIEILENKLPPTSEIYKVLEQVTVIAQKKGLQPKTIRTLEKKNNSGYVEQPLKMELEGGFNSFYSFLLELEKLPRIMKIRELDLKKRQEGQITASFVMSIFFQNQKG